MGEIFQMDFLLEPKHWNLNKTDKDFTASGFVKIYCLQKCLLTPIYMCNIKIVPKTNINSLTPI